MNEQETFSSLYNTIKYLRSPEGCPWDKEQTPLTLLNHLLEEIYELLDAIKEGNQTHIKEELGDVYLVLTMIASIFEEGHSPFSVTEVLIGINQKIISRHPHVFGDIVARTAEEGLASWQAAKKAEGREERSTFDKVGRGLPPLERSAKIEDKMAKLGYTFTNIDDAMGKVDEELEEFKAEIRSGNLDKQEDELGDVFLTLVMVARQRGIDPSQAVHRANNKVTARMNFIEKELALKGLTLKEATADQIEEQWQNAKKAGN